jgi:hypothetical protein
MRRIADSKASLTRKRGQRRSTANRALASENVQDFRRLDANALARRRPRAPLIFTTNRQFLEATPSTIGRLVTALDALLAAQPDLVTALFLKPSSPPGRFVPRAPRAIHQPCRPLGARHSDSASCPRFAGTGSDAFVMRRLAG